MRSFVAIDLAPEVRASAASAIAELRSIAPRARWVEPGALHLTLLFLGTIDPGLVPAIGATLDATCLRHRPFELTVEALGVFGSSRRPRVLWAGLGGATAALLSLQRDVESAVRETLAGTPALETRPYAGHVTLARARDPRGEPSLAVCLERLPLLRLGAQTVAEMVLYESRTLPGGAVHTPVSRHPLR